MIKLMCPGWRISNAPKIATVGFLLSSGIFDISSVAGSGQLAYNWYSDSIVLIFYMSNQIIVDGKAIAAELRANLKAQIAEVDLAGQFTLAVILVGDDEASRIYVQRKQEAAAEVGINCEVFSFPASIAVPALQQEILNIQSKEGVVGVIVQFPLPNNIWSQTREVTSVIDPLKDVDCLTHHALGQSIMGEQQWLPPIVGAVEEIFARYRVEIQGKRVCLVGRGELIGKPLASYFLNKPVVLSVCGRDAQPLADYTSQADILISGVGRPGLIGEAEVKEGVVVIDMATAYENGKVRGDVDFTAVQPKTSLITPVPGGVGPITVAKLLENTYKAALLQL